MFKPICLLICIFQAFCSCQIDVDFNSRGRVFDGIGAISGGGAVARLLPLYPEPQRSEVIDYLFKPRFGASLHIFKVEIGGDDQSTQGTESSYRHYEWEKGNFNRGYEFWFLKEAKKRNPNIKIAALPWSYPGFLGRGDNFFPYADVNKTAEYITGWMQGVKSEWGVDVDYIGLWNEKPDYPPFIKALYHKMKELDLKAEIVAGDNHWEIVDWVKEDPELYKMVSKLGIHYPGEYSPKKGITSGIPLWSSEDDSTDLYTTKPGCIARILNRNYVTGYFTSTIIWNIISSFYDDIAYPRTGLLTANQPWSGWYQVDEPIWLIAHTTQFVEPGWKYLEHGSGVGYLEGESGSYVTLVSPDDESVFTIVIETIDHVMSVCKRPPVNPYPTAKNQTLTFSLKNWKVNTLPKLYVRFSDLATGEMFVAREPIQVGMDLTFKVNVSANQLITLSTVGPGVKGSFEGIPGSGPKLQEEFPFPYSDNFESTEIDKEGEYFQQQAGVFEVQESSEPNHGHVLKQMLLQHPITWCPIPNLRPVALFGNHNWSSISYSVDIKLPEINGTKTAFIAARIKAGGCKMWSKSGVFAWVNPSENEVFIAEKLMALTPTCRANHTFTDVNDWFNMELSLNENKVSLKIDGNAAISDCQLKKDLKNGFVGIGTEDFKFALYDNVKVGSLESEVINV